MAREIKFRAWDKINNRMKDPFNIRDLEAIEYDGQGFLDNGCFNGINDHWDNYTLMQYTGLKDKNGIEIYEGDIVEFPHGMGIIGFCQLSCQYFIFVKKSGFKARYAVNNDYIPKTNVIGNIYENPELINQ